MQLLNVKFCAFAQPAPDDRAALLMNLEHVLLRFFTGESEDFLKDHRHITHQIDRVVMHNDLPGKIDLLLLARLLLDDRTLRRRGKTLFVQQHFGLRTPWLPNHGREVNIPRLHFKPGTRRPIAEDSLGHRASEDTLLH